MKTLPLSSLAALFAAVILVPALPAQNKDEPAPGRTPTTPGPDLPAPGRPSESATRPGHDPAPAPASEADFVQTAAKGGMGEVKIAELAVKKARDEKVKEFAHMLVKDHTAANEELKTAAASANITLSTTPDAKAEEKYARLNKAEGKQFDKAFLDEMAMCHEKNIAYYEAGKKVAKSAPVTAFIDKTLPVIKRHAEKIEELRRGDRPDAGTRPDPTRPGTRGEPRPGTTPGPATDPAPERLPDPVVEGPDVKPRARQ